MSSTQNSQPTAPQPTPPKGNKSMFAKPGKPDVKLGSDIGSFKNKMPK